MFMLRRTHRARVAQLQQVVERQREHLGAQNLRLQVELGLVKQARTKADADTTYWRLRAEKFIDQIAFRQGIISEPTMTEAAPPVESRLDNVFAALGTSEINRDKGSVAGADDTAPSVTGVNTAAAQAAVEDVLASIGRSNT